MDNEDKIFDAASLLAKNCIDLVGKGHCYKCPFHGNDDEALCQLYFRIPGCWPDLIDRVRGKEE